MTFYIKMVAPVIYYPGQSYEPKKKYVEDPVVWYPEDEIPRLKEKYSSRLEDENGWYVLGFEAKYEPYAVEPRFKKLKVPEKCGKCQSCNAAITGSPYCRMEVASSVNPQMDISSVYVNIDSRPVWCPIIKINNELDEMPIEKRSNIDNLITGLTSLLGGEDLWEEEE